MAYGKGLKEEDLDCGRISKDLKKIFKCAISIAKMCILSLHPMTHRLGQKGRGQSFILVLSRKVRKWMPKIIHMEEA